MVKDHSKALKVYSKFYYFFAICAIALLALMLGFGDQIRDALKDSLNTVDLNGVDPITALNIFLGGVAVLYLLLGFLSSRVARGKSNGIALMVLLVLHIISGVISLVRSFSVVSCAILVIDALALYSAIEIKKENKE